MTRELLVGMVFFVLLAGLLGATLWIDDPGFLRAEPASELSVRFPDVAGLKPGADVWVNGTEAGRVEAIEQNGADGVLVRLSLLQDPGLREDAKISIKASSALGGVVVAIDPGSPDAAPSSGEGLTGVTAGDAFGEIAELAADLRGPLMRTLENLEKITDDVQAKSESIVENIDGFAENARALTDDLRGGKGTLGLLLTDDKMYRDLEAAVAALRQLGDDAQGGGGTLDLLLHDKEMAAEIREGVKRLNSFAGKLDADKGTLGRLLNDATLYDDLAGAAADARAIVADARGGNGLLGKLIYDEKLANRVDRISVDIKEITGKLRRGEGTLGRLIQDEEVYADLREALRGLNQGTTTARENAPILTFAGFLFGSF